jgi:hypothetical protein
MTREEDIDREAGTLHLILAFVKGVMAGPNSAHETGRCPPALSHSGLAVRGACVSANP